MRQYFQTLPSIPMGKIKSIKKVKIYVSEYGDLYFYQFRENGYYGWWNGTPYKNVKLELLGEL